jgi:PAS domain S-box-containing protein
MLAKPLKLLFVEDSARDAELTLLTLERSGLELDTVLVHNHRGAEEALQAHTFDLILSDFMLPGSSGAQVLESARKHAAYTPFIFLSGIFGEEHAVAMMRQGAIDYVLKQNLPLLPKAVNRALAEVHERQQRQRAERSLHDVEARARLAIDAAQMGTWDYDPRSGQLIWDQRCRALYAVDDDIQVDLDVFYARCHPDDLPLLRQRVDEALAGPEDRGYQVDYRVMLADGGERWLSTSGRSTFLDGQCVRFTGVIQDISEQKQNTEALERLNELLGDRVQKRTRERDRTWELSRELLAVMTFELVPIALNPAWEVTLGWTRQQLLDGRLLELVHPDDIVATEQEIQHIATGKVSSRFVNRMRHAAGDYRWLSWTMVPDEGLMYAAVRDITGERAIVDELAATNQRLRDQINQRERIEAALHQMQRLEAVGQLTAGVAHDFNNLLTVILASASFLSRDLEKGKFDKFRSRLQSIQEAGERGAKLTGQLLSFSRRQRLEPLPVNLNDTLLGMFELLQRSLGGSVWVQTDTSADLWNALVDPTQTEMIILNLAINARDAMPNGGTLGLRTSNEVVSQAPQRPEEPEPGRYVVLSIADSGSGMSDEVLAKAFEPFFTTKEVGKGSGLGLAQVFGFAKQSGGGVSIDTEVGRGTTVRVFLPAIRDLAPEQVVAAIEAPQAPPDSTQRTILLVDDDDTVRGVTLTMVEGLGYKVLAASSGAAALAMLDEPIDLVLTDYAMPGMTGAELAVSIQQRLPGLPVVFITGFAEPGGLDPRTHIIVQKPFRGDELATKLRRALQLAAAPL